MQSELSDEDGVGYFASELNAGVWIVSLGYHVGWQEQMDRCRR